MKTISPTLLATQKLPAGQPYAVASLQDNSRLHPTLTVSGSWAGNGTNTIGCLCNTFYLRLRFVASVLTIQKITDPTVSSQWTTWSAFQPFEAGSAYGIALFWEGTYAVACWIDYTATGNIYYSRSTDGVAWSAKAIAHAGSPGVPINLAGISAAGSFSGLAMSYGKRVHFMYYNSTPNTWSAVDDNGYDLTDVTPQVAGFYDTVNARYVFAVETNTFVTWCTYAIVLITRVQGGTPQTWSAGQVLFGGAGQHYNGINFCQYNISGNWWMFFSKTRLWPGLGGSYKSPMYVSASTNGTDWQDPLPTDIPGDHQSLCLMPHMSTFNNYLATEDLVYRLDTYGYWLTAPVISYRLNTGHGGRLSDAPTGKDADQVHRSPTIYQGAAAPGQSTLVALLDNRDGSLIAPRPWSVFTINRGYVLPTGQQLQSAGTWYVKTFRYLKNDSLLEITATDAHGLLAAWFAHTVGYLSNRTILNLCQTACALAGVVNVAFDSFPAWSDLITSFAQPAKYNARYSLSALAQRLPFEYFAKEDGSLYFYVPTPSPASTYTYGAGAGQHVMWPNNSNFGGREAPNYVQIVGATPRTIVAEAMNMPDLYGGGIPQTIIVGGGVEVIILTQAQVLAAAVLTALKEERLVGVFEAPPNMALEPGDVISFGTGSAFAAANSPWRVVEIEEFYNSPPGNPFFQRITVRGTA